MSRGVSVVGWDLGAGGCNCHLGVTEMSGRKERLSKLSHVDI